MDDRLAEIKKGFYVKEDDMNWLIYEVERLDKENDNLDAENDQLKDENDGWDAENKQLKEENERLRAENKQLHQFKAGVIEEKIFVPRQGGIDD